MIASDPTRKVGRLAVEGIRERRYVHGFGFGGGKDGRVVILVEEKEGLWRDACVRENNNPMKLHFALVLMTRVATDCKKLSRNYGDETGAAPICMREFEPNSWEDTMKDEVDQSKYPHMPWYDFQCALWGPPCRDVARHFVQC
ncbi:Phospholipase D p2 [Dendrobium catenatum]|uniref:Phospholipase D p2 n=1 Tax=Dendrobium catenatum TaxID=906689 RepID=A0A2I0X6K4_9ASPA|nr:Phospholipase D p2 [Dendrobium catenatum]